jgi:hypothetical protein
MKRTYVQVRAKAASVLIISTLLCAPFSAFADTPAVVTTTISSITASPTNAGSIPIDVTFSVPVTGFESDIVLDNATLEVGSLTSNLDGSAYNFVIDPQNSGPVSVDVADAAAQDADQNPNTAGTFQIVYDTQSPHVALCTDVGCTNPFLYTSQPFVIHTNFTLPVQGFTYLTITADNATVDSVTQTDVAGANYDITVHPAGEGAFSVRLPGSAAHTAAGNGNIGSNTISGKQDTVAPIITLDGPADGSSTSTNLVDFSWTTADDSDLSEVCAIDGDTAAPCTSPVEMSALDNGVHTFALTSTDAAGNYSTQSRSFTVNIPCDTNVSACSILAGTVFNDGSTDGAQGVQEAGLENWVIVATPTLADGSTDGTRSILSTTTIADGSYMLPVPSPFSKNWSISVQAQSGWLQTSPASTTYTVAPTSTSAISGLLFGETPFKNVQGAVFVASSGDTASTSAIQTLDATSTVEVTNAQGTSTVVISPTTIITKVDGSSLDLNSFTTSTTASTSLTGLGAGTVVDGALQWGIPGAGLVFNQPITVSIFVGTDFNGQTLTVFRSPNPDSGWTQDGIVAPGTCTVTLGYCTFQATHASYYAVTHTPAAPGAAVAHTPENTGSGSNGGGVIGGTLAIGYQQPAPVVAVAPAAPAPAPASNSTNTTVKAPNDVAQQVEVSQQGSIDESAASAEHTRNSQNITDLSAAAAQSNATIPTPAIVAIAIVLIAIGAFVTYRQRISSK